MPTVKPKITPRHPEAPTTLGECPTSRPCPWVGCRYHLLLQVAEDGKLSMNRPKKTPGRRPGVHATPDAQWFVDAWIERAAEAVFEMEHTCAFDLVAAGGLTYEEIGDILGMPKQNVEKECARARRVLKEDGCG